MMDNGNRRARRQLTPEEKGSNVATLGPRHMLTWAWNLSSSSTSLMANPGGPYTVTRGGTVSLDGSRSTPRGKITSYKWRFDKPEKCYPKGASPSRGTKQGMRPSAVMLCTMRVTLTVREGARHASNSITIEVTPRPWTTSVRHNEFLRGGGINWVPPVRYPSGSKPCKGVKGICPAGLLGINVSACPGATALTKDIFCPLRSLHQQTWEGSGYKLAEVHDHGGPFDRWWYVGSSDLTIDRKALLNPYLYSGAPKSPFGETPNFYSANTGARTPTDVGGMLQALMEHEGWGKPSVAHSGHTSAMKEAITVHDRLFDPRRSIEQYS